MAGTGFPGPEVQLTEDGQPWCPLVAERNRLISPASEEFRVLCEARYILDRPRSKEARTELVSGIAAKRTRSFGRGNEAEAAAADMRQRLKDAVNAEWYWRQPKPAEGEAA